MRNLHTTILTERYEPSDSPKCPLTNSSSLLSGTSTPCLCRNSILLERCRILSTLKVGLSAGVAFYNELTWHLRQILLLPANHQQIITSECEKSTRPVDTDPSDTGLPSPMMRAGNSYSEPTPQQFRPTCCTELPTRRADSSLASCSVSIVSSGESNGF